MLGRFYQRYSKTIVGLVLLSLPVLSVLSLDIRPLNDIETWMPESDPARVRYEEFKRSFGVEEFILIAFDRQQSAPPDSDLIEAMCVRLERLPEIRHCWSPSRMQAIMNDLGVPAADAEKRLQGLLTNSQDSLAGVVAILSDTGYRHRTETVQCVREELRYCLLDGEKTLLAGSPLFVAELDRLGSKEANTIYFMVTLGICLGILYYLIREWKLTGLVFLVTVWTIDAAILLLHQAGVEINLLLASIPVLVMVLTMSVSVHYLYYYREALDRSAADPVIEGIRAAWWPTLIATLTTCIGELALSVSDIAPIRHFAYAAALGSVLSMIGGLGITPMLVVVCPTLPRRSEYDMARYSRLAAQIVGHSRSIAVATIVVTIVSCIGLARLRANMNVADFLPEDSKVRRDFLRVQRDLTPVDSIEFVVSFEDDKPFVERLQRVRSIESVIRRQPGVDQTLSLADFFPDPLPQNPLVLLPILQTAVQQRSSNEFAVDGERLWRISARIRKDAAFPRQQLVDDLTAALQDEPVTLTGMSVLVDSTQREIFNSFWQSIGIALLLITLAIMVFLRSIPMGLTAMLPNVAPICWIYGLLGWLNWPIDIAMMLSGSIALGLSVDGTFHFMSHFRMHWRSTGSAEQAARSALLESSIPFSQATLTTTAGMLGLTLSAFAPTARFGWLMIALMLAALIGDVVMLPALVRLVGGTTRKRQPAVTPDAVAASTRLAA